MSTVVPLGPAAVDITGVRAGDRNRITVTITNNGAPLDLTGYTVEAQARPSPTASSVITAVTEITDAAAGRVDIRWPGAEVATILGTRLTWRGVWDLQIGTADEDPVTVAAGKFSAEMDVTR